MIYVVNSDRRSRVDAMLWGGQSAPGGRPFLTGRDFLDELSHLPPGVVIIDVENAGMNGFDLIEAAVTASSNAP
jgi:FixJ family two-component response regulator